MSLRNRFRTAGFAHLLKVAGPGLTLILDSRRRSFTGRAPKGIALAFAFIATVAAQVPLPIPNQNASNPIMGFETPEGWIVKSSSVATRVLSTTTRTQGSFAFELVNPPNVATLTSLPVPSTARALAGVGDLGAIFEVDVMPAQHADTGSLKLSVSSPSRGLKNELVGEVEFKGFRPGIYSTLKFPIPDKVRSALGVAAFQDLTFEFTLSSPPTGLPVTSAAVEFRFDNLRVHSIPLVAAKAGIKPPAGFGGSVDLVAIGEEPVSQSFNIGAVQVPDGFHLEQGTAGSTKVRLALGHDGNSAFTCTYDDGPTEKSGKSYILSSCTGGVQAGDIVGANFAQLTIVGGSSLMKIRAQLAKNPAGDLVGGGIIPPMPTFWGNFDGCIPAPVPGKVRTVSPSCANQITETNQIVTDYFNKVNDAKTAPNWIVTPALERARRHGNGLPNNNLPRPTQPHIRPLDPSSQSNDIPFDQEGHMNPGGDFDAYWRLNGDLNANNDPSSVNTSTHIDAAFSGHVVLFGGDVNVVSLNATADTTSGSSPSATGSLHMFLFGQELPGGGSADASTGFNFKLSESQDFNLPPIPIWIFSITLGATASAGVTANGTLAVTGFNLTLTPFASMGAHIEGGIDLGIASGGVDARIDLLDISTPLTAQAGWSVNPNPGSCSTTLNFALNGQAEISSGGGEVDLVATFGICPFCDSESWTLVSWGPLASSKQTLFDFPLVNQAFPLPAAVCTQPLSVAILSPTSTALINQLTPLNGIANSPNAGVVDCKNYTWSVSPPESLVPSSQGCNVSAIFKTLGPHTLTLSAVDNIVNPFETITETGSTSKSITVTQLPPGTYITGTTCVDPSRCSVTASAQPPFNGQFLSILVGHFPAFINLLGEVIPPAGTVTTWTATDSSGKTTPIPACFTRICPPPILGSSNQITAAWTVPTNDEYTITMTTKDTGGKAIGTATMKVNAQLIPR